MKLSSLINALVFDKHFVCTTIKARESQESNLFYHFCILQVFDFAFKYIWWVSFATFVYRQVPKASSKEALLSEKAYMQMTLLVFGSPYSSFQGLAWLGCTMEDSFYRKHL